MIKQVIQDNFIDSGFFPIFIFLLSLISYALFIFCLIYFIIFNYFIKFYIILMKNIYSSII